MLYVMGVVVASAASVTFLLNVRQRLLAFISAGAGAAAAGFFSFAAYTALVASHARIEPIAFLVGAAGISIIMGVTLGDGFSSLFKRKS